MIRRRRSAGVAGCFRGGGAGLFRHLACAVFVAVLTVASNEGSVRAMEYSNRELGFRLRLPDGFEEVTGGGPEGAMVVRARFNRDKSLSRLLSIQDLGEVIRQDANFSRLRGARGNVKREKMSWRDFEVDVFNVTEGDRGLIYVSLNAQVPLKPRAIQVTMSALKTDERALRSEMETLLASIEGPSNWISSNARAASESAGVVRTAVTVAALLILVSAALWVISRVQE